MMGAFEIILVLLLLFFIVEAFKHSFSKRVIKLGITIFVILIVLVVAGYYFNLGEFFAPDSMFSKTGASVVTDVQENIDLEDLNINLDDTLDLLGDIGSDGFDYIKKSNITEKIIY